MKLNIINGRFSVCQVRDLSEIPWNTPYCFLCKTEEELSLVCAESDVPGNTIQREDGWRMFRFVGTLDFSLLGILAQITTLLAETGVSVFAVSTFNTDYLLVREAQFQKALDALRDTYEIQQGNVG